MEIEEQGNGSSKNNSNFLCRQSSTRWTPTTDQIRILKDLYYNNGVRSPTAEQIQRISAKLRQYGKIEGKNVFYWFQNHKARERQKKRFSVPENHQYMNIPMHKLPPVWRNNNVDEHHLLPIYNNNNNFTNITGSGGGGTSGGGGGGFSTGGYNFGNYGPSYGSMAMEKSFRDCSIAAGGGSLGQSSISWVGVNHDPYPNYYPFLDKQKSYFNGHDKTLETDQEDDEENNNTTEMETLPLFPTQHGGAKLSGSDGAAHVDNFNGWLHRRRGSNAETCPRASLELTLNSCFTNFTN